ncbi:hypothetical protein [uncultured Pseudokineococcus sp.]|uniref:hypothetical protein n=1 Tax=uncultured Pseudokineococcus sp. TaxID=1642928 RepID=UPI00263310B4|nr:hypothetical protein [uncultured Pseudokineococcus sp.]
MTSDASTADDREPTTGEPQDSDPQDSDGDPGQMPHRAHVRDAVDGVAQDDTEPGSDPDGDPEELRSGS